MSDTILFYLAVGRLVKENGVFVEGKHEIIASATHPTSQSSEKDYVEHVRKIMDSGSKLKVGKRIRLTADGVGAVLTDMPSSPPSTPSNKHDVHVFCDTLGETVLVYCAVTSTDFNKSQSAAKLLDDFKAGFVNINKASEIDKAREKGCQKTSEPLFAKLFSMFGSDKLKNVQEKVDQVKGVMQQNVTKALANVDALNELEDKSEHFENQAKNFQKSATNVKKMMRCKNIKMTLLLGGVVLIIIIIIIASVVPSSSGSSDSNNP